MFSIKANIKFTDENRQEPISGNTYRPLLFFPPDVIRSGLIMLRDNEALFLNHSYKDIVFQIYFYGDLDTSNVFSVGKEFEILDATSLIGYGIITEVLGVSNLILP